MRQLPPSKTYSTANTIGLTSTTLPTLIRLRTVSTTTTNPNLPKTAFERLALPVGAAAVRARIAFDAQQFYAHHLAAISHAIVAADAIIVLHAAAAMSFKLSVGIVP